MGKALSLAGAGIVFAGALIYVFWSGGLFPAYVGEAGQRAIMINNTPVKVVVAGTPEEQQRGLGGRDNLGPNQGMLFTFEKDDYYGIWMKDMHFPIDILWLDRQGTIVDLQQGVHPETYPRVFYPAAAARYVVELPAGFVEQYNVGIGQRVSI